MSQRKKNYIIELTQDDDKTLPTLELTNDGFSEYELLGLMEFIQLEILAKIKGNIEPNLIEQRHVQG